MKTKKSYSDSVFQNLLSQYKRPELGTDALTRLDSLIESGVPAQRVRQVSFSNFALAASALLLVGIGFLLTIWQSTVPTPYQIAGGEQQTKNLVLLSGATELSVLTANESIVLAPATRLKVSGDPLRRFSGDNRNRYRLEQGSVYIDHTAGSPAFTLETAWGIIQPLGTVLNCVLTADGLELTCLEDALTLTIKRKVVYVVKAGEKLTLSERGKVILITPLEDTAIEPEAVMEPVGAVVLTDLQLERPVAHSAVPRSVLWTVPLSAKPARLHLLSAVVVLVYPDRLETRSLQDGGVRGTALLSSAIAHSEISDEALITHAGEKLTAYRVSGLERLWESRTGITAFTAFTVSDGQLFIPSADGNLYIHDAATGEILTMIPAGTGLYGKPFVSEGTVYFSTLDRRIIAADTASGRQLWEYSGELRFVSDKPLLVGSLLVTFGTEGKFIALNKDDGELLWTADYEDKILAGPLLWNGQIVFADGGGLKTLSPQGEARQLSDSAYLSLQVINETLFAVDSGSVKSFRPGMAGETELSGNISDAAFSGQRVLLLDNQNMLSCYNLSE